MININDFDYPLPDERIAKFPLERRDSSKLLVYRNGEISERRFSDIGSELSSDTLFVFNNTKVVRARLVMHKPSGARVEVFCLEPHTPADYEHAFAVKGECEWSCIVGNLKKWKEGAVEIPFEYVIEMICDWWSFSWKKGDLNEIFKWYEDHKGMMLHPETRKLVESILARIKEKLEEG